MSDDAERPEELPNDPAEASDQPGHALGTNVRAMEFWDDVMGDMEATAAEYDAEGWETLQLHPGDVTALAPDGDDDRFGLDVLVPDDEFEAVEHLVADGASFDAYEVYRASADGLVLLVVAMEDHDAERAVLFPAYYDADAGEGMLAAADRAGEMHSYLRTLTNDRIQFTHEDPEPFSPPSAGD